LQTLDHRWQRSNLYNEGYGYSV